MRVRVEESHENPDGIVTTSVEMEDEVAYSPDVLTDWLHRAVGALAIDREARKAQG